MNIGGRSLATIFKAPLERRHYAAAANMLRVYLRPLDLYGRYLFGGGAYPAAVEVKTPLGDLALQLYSPHDVLTLNEVFCRNDYPASEGDTIVVDFGTNIGVSAAYFLTRSESSFVYCFEPLPVNIERLRQNLKRFDSRYTLSNQAVGLRNGAVEFGWEESGRYGGIGRKTGQYLTVECVDSNETLQRILALHGRIDILKIDVETLERQIIERIPEEIARSIRAIYAEHRFSSNPLSSTHDHRQYGSVAQFRRTERSAAELTGRG